MRRIIVSIGTVLALAGPAWAAGPEETWESYLDYAYVFSSASPEVLQSRLVEYGREADMELDAYLARLESKNARMAEGENGTRRRAIGHLLAYLASGDPESLDLSVEAVRDLEGRLTRHENRYWYHYILAHRALERGHAHDFVGEILDLWLRVVIPMEGPYESLQALSLSDAANSGFVSALPYVFENMTRIVLIRSQAMGLNRDLDPLAGVMRLLKEGRVGAHPDVIPPAASARGYLDRIVARLDGPESDGGSLTFTLALFEAGGLHDRARSRLARDGFSAETRKAIRVSSGAYRVALDRADTVQGKAAVYTRVLRQMGEIYAAKQRLGIDADVEMPFSIEGAIEVWADLERMGEEGCSELASGGADAYSEALRSLWEEIQEATLNTADYYLARAVAEPHTADESSRNAARVVSRLLSFFERHASSGDQGAVPDSAYFAAYEAARTFGEAFLVYAAEPTPGQVDLATRSFRRALSLFPFDWRLWPALTQALERHGREGDFMSLAGPVAEALARSRAVDTWIDLGEPGAKELAALRTALSDSQVLMVLGFGGALELEEVESDLADLRRQRGEAAGKLSQLQRRRAAIENEAPPAAPDFGSDSIPASAAGSPELIEVAREMASVRARVARLDRQIEASSRALPLYRSTADMDELIASLRGQRGHPVHTLLRRMYHEARS